MHHIAAYFGSMAAGAVNTQVPALLDSKLTRQNANFLLPKAARLLAAYAMGASITRARINTPKFRLIALPHLQPVERAAAPSDVPNLVLFNGNELILDPVDEISLETSNDLGAASENHYGLFWLDFGSQPPPVGPVYTIRATASITATANAWTSGSITLEQSLPGGRYAVVGLDVITATGVGARLVYPDTELRPGVLARTSKGNSPHPIFRNGKFGDFGTFASFAMPSLEVLCTGADTSQEIFLDLIKVSNAA